MLVTVENTGALSRRLTVQVPAQEVKTATRSKLNEFKSSKKEKIPGFRNNAAIPEKILEQRFGLQAKEAAVRTVIETTLPKALEQEQLKPAEKPRVERLINEDNTDLEYVVSFEIFPDVKPLDFSLVKAEKIEVSVKEADVEKTIERLQAQFADWVQVERDAKLSDRVVVDYTSTMNGKPYKGNQGQDVAIEIGTNLFIEGFETGLIGRKAGDEFILDLTFPNNWRMEKLAGKAVQFKVKVKSVAEKKFAELNLGFAKKIGAESARH